MENETPLDDPLEVLSERLAALTTAVTNLTNDNDRLRGENSALTSKIEAVMAENAMAAGDAAGKVQAILDSISSPLDGR